MEAAGYQGLAVEAIAVNGWVTIGGLAGLPAARRTGLLAGAVFDLILVRVMLALHGPWPAAMVYAARGARVRIEDGEIVIWAGP